jgi:glycosyltransferase involved in cell wall biosynthesis
VSDAAPTIAVCIVCRNEADKLVDCVASAQWADEVVVLDLQSTDGSADVAAKLGARVVQHAPLPIVEPLRNVAADEVSTDWVLALDPDERVSPGLATELRRISRFEGVDLVEIPFMHVDLGHPPSHPLLRFDPKPRMYRRVRVRWPEEPHGLPAVERSKVYAIAARDELVMRHERSRNLGEILDRAVRYAPAQAQAMLDRGEVFSARAMTRDLAERAYRQVVLARAYRDGVPGLLRAGVLVHYHFCVWLELWQRSGARRTEEDDRYVARLGRAVEVLERLARLANAPRRFARRRR